MPGGLSWRNVRRRHTAENMNQKAIEPPPSLYAIFMAFALIALISVGGGVSGWMMRDFVTRRRWIASDEFLSGLALAQAFPGINVVNLTIWMGYRFRGNRGVVVATLGLLVPAIAVAIAIVSVFSELSHISSVHYALAGISAAAIGLSLEMGIFAARQSMTGLLPILITIATFVSIFVFGVSLIWVIAIVTPCSIAAAWWHMKKIRGAESDDYPAA